MSRPPECAATFFKTWRSILVGHLGLQSVTYRVETPCTKNLKIERQKLNTLYSRNFGARMLLKSWHFSANGKKFSYSFFISLLFLTTSPLAEDFDVSHDKFPGSHSS
jgi:hypothetical protein